MIQTKESKNACRGSLLSSVFFVLLFFVCGAGVSPTHAAQDSYDSLYVSTLNMTDEEIKSTYGTPKEDSIEVKPTMQELHEDSPQYERRVYNHKQQVIVGSVVMLCVVIAMVMMNNYNPTR